VRRQALALSLSLAAACERDQLPAPPPTPRDAGKQDAAVVDGACDVSDDRIEIGERFALQFHGKSFAMVSGSVQHVEIHVTDRGSMATSTNGVATLTGDIVREDIRVRPRHEQLEDGWLAIRGAPLPAKTSDPVSLVVELSSLVAVDHMPTVRVACRDLTLAAAQDPRLKSATSMILRRGTTSPLAREPAGMAFARVVAQTLDPDLGLDFEDSVLVLSERSGWAQIAITSSQADVFGWIAKTALAPAARGMIGLMGDSMKSGRWVTKRCSDSLPIYVRDADITQRVGATVPGAMLDMLDTSGTMNVDLGAEPSQLAQAISGNSDDTLRPFVQRDDAHHCKPASAH
jgi:hypothetical protein